MARWQHNDSEAYGPAVFDAEPATATLAAAEAALRRGDAKLAKATYLRALGKLGPFADPAWRSTDAEDHRTRSQCHARLAAIAFDEDDFQRSLRQTAAAAAARRDAIAAEQCTGDDVRFMITALVHAATVHERIGEQSEAIESCKVALEFSRYAEHNDHDPKTRRSIASAERAATRLLNVLTANQTTQQTAGAERLSAGMTQAPHAVVSAQQGGDHEEHSDLIEQIDIAGITTQAPRAESEPLDLIELSDSDPTEPGGRVDQEPLDLVDVGENLFPPPPAAGEALDLVDVGERIFEPAPGGDEPEPAPLLSEPLDLVAVDEQAERSTSDFVDLTDPAMTPPIEFVAVPPAGVAPPAAGPVADRAEPPEIIIDLTDPRPTLTEPDVDPDVIDLTDQAEDNRFERRTDWLRAKAAERRAKAAEQAERLRVEQQDQVDRRQSDRTHESPAILLARARAQAMLARFLLTQSPDEAVINAHRAVRTATRARQWAKHDHNATPQVALALIDTLVTRSDVLAAMGNPEVGRTDLRRSRAISEQLWQVCPSVTTAAAAVLVAARSASFEWRQGNQTGAIEYLEQARVVINEGESMGLTMPAELTAFCVPLNEIGGEPELTVLGDRVLDDLQAGRFDTREISPAVARS